MLCCVVALNSLSGGVENYLQKQVLNAEINKLKFNE